jgi:hypothetical protein
MHQVVQLDGRLSVGKAVLTAKSKWFEHLFCKGWMTRCWWHARVPLPPVGKSKIR